MHEFPAASTHVKRHLKPYERAAIAVGLELLARLPASEALDDVRLAMMHDGECPSNDTLRALAQELLTARKVKLCRSKTSAT